MARKYCRYCAFCICGDAYYCTNFDKVLHSVTSATNCSSFSLSALGDVDTGKQYKPREPAHTDSEYDDAQIKLDEALK